MIPSRNVMKYCISSSFDYGSVNTSANGSVYAVNPMSVGCGEHILAYSAKRAFEVFGKIFKLCAGSDSSLGITEFLIVFPTACVTYIFHN
jgi:hypothetical protein